MYELEFLTGARAGDIVPVHESMVAGRAEDCGVRLPEKNASRQHANFDWDGTKLLVRDNGSSNGTFVNGERVEEIELAEGDVVRFGVSQLRVKLHDNISDIPADESFFDFEEKEPDNLDKSVMLSVIDISTAATEPAPVLAARLKAVIDVSRALADIQDTKRVFDRVLDSLFEVFPQADRAFLMLGNTAEQLEAKAMRTRSGDDKDMKVSTSICRHALETRQAILFNSMETAGFEVGKSVIGLGIRSAMSVPLMVGDEIEGLLQVDTPDVERPFLERDLELAISVGQQVAIALRNALLLKRVESETKTRNNLMRFLPTPLVEQTLSGEIELGLGGRSCHGTILFSDVVGFTRISESLKPEEVVALMNRYFDRMVPCISQTSGAIDKYIGDAIMAFWGIPIGKDGDAACAAESALAMQNALFVLNNSLTLEGKKPLHMGLGLNTGPVVAGNIGSHDRTEYTVLGDTVNTSQRIESSACASQVLVSQDTLKAIGQLGFAMQMPPLSVKNKAEPLTVFSLRGLGMLGEILTHLPLRSGDHKVLMVRQLADLSFVVLHPPDCHLEEHDLLTSMVEWPDESLGRPEIVEYLGKESDGGLGRTVINLDDSTLLGLLGDQPLRCALPWDQMPRSLA